MISGTNYALTYGSILGTANQVTVTPTASSITISLPATAVSTTIGSQSANVVYASPNGSAGNMGPRALVKADLPATTVSTNQSNTFSTGTQDFSDATALRVPVSTTAAPTVNGIIAYNSTQRNYVAGEASSTVSFVRTLSTQFATSDSLDCNTIGTTETAFNTQYTFPASFFIANKTVQISGVYEGKFNTATAVRLSARLQSAGPTNVTFVQLASATPASTAGTFIGGGFLLLLQGTEAPSGSADLEGGILSIAYPLSGTYNTIPQPVTVATNAAQTFQLTVTFGTACGTLGNNVVALRQLHIQEMN